MTDLVAALALIVVGYVAVVAFRRLRVRRQRADAALAIKPPRRFVDKDGRSEFRHVTAEAVRLYRGRQ